MKNDKDQEIFRRAALACHNRAKGRGKKQTERKDKGYKQSSMGSWKNILIGVMSCAALFGPVSFVQNKTDFSFRKVDNQILSLSRDMEEILALSSLMKHKIDTLSPNMNKMTSGLKGERATLESKMEQLVSVSSLMKDKVDNMTNKLDDAWPEESCKFLHYIITHVDVDPSYEEVYKRECKCNEPID